MQSILESVKHGVCQDAAVLLRKFSLSKYIKLFQGLVNVPFWEYWTSPYSSHYRPYTQWLGDVQWGHLINDPCLSRGRGVIWIWSGKL